MLWFGLGGSEEEAEGEGGEEQEPQFFDALIADV